MIWHDMTCRGYNYAGACGTIYTLHRDPVALLQSRLVCATVNKLTKARGRIYSAVVDLECGGFVREAKGLFLDLATLSSAYMEL